MAAPEKTADCLPAFESFWSCEAWHCLPAEAFLTAEVLAEEGAYAVYPPKLMERRREVQK
jgi:hypothetical protein